MWVRRFSEKELLNKDGGIPKVLRSLLRQPNMHLNSFP